ncbi:MAG TPA: hypothetical protein VK927_09600, partial [Adhaeribacter sp.]|nr:hypothetical protein [Adhaeribacter sp.]
LELTQISANCLHPGAVATNFGQGSSRTIKLLFMMSRPFLPSAAKGAQTPIYLASAPELEGISGEYFINKKPVRSSKLSYDYRLARRLWQLSESQTGFQA